MHFPADQQSLGSKKGLRGLGVGISGFRFEGLGSEVQIQKRATGLQGVRKVAIRIARRVGNGVTVIAILVPWLP